MWTASVCVGEYVPLYVYQCVCVPQVQVQSRVLCKQMKIERESDENQKLRRFDGGCKKIKLATA